MGVDAAERLVQTGPVNFEVGAMDSAHLFDGGRQRRRNGARAVLAGGLVLAAGCRKPYDPVDCDDAEHHCLQGEVFDTLARRLEGVEMCWRDTEEPLCATTDEDGAFTLPGLPMEGDIVVSTVIEGYSRVLYPIDAATIPRISWEAYLVSDGLAESQADKFDIEIDPGNGLLLVDIGVQISTDPIKNDHMSGGTVTIEPAAGTQTKYLNTFFLPSDSLEATGGNGFAAVGNVKPGEVAIQARSEAGPCATQLMAWDFEADGSVHAPIEAGWTTFLGVGCPE